MAEAGVLPARGIAQAEERHRCPLTSAAPASGTVFLLFDYRSYWVSARGASLDKSRYFNWVGAIGWYIFGPLLKGAYHDFLIWLQGRFFELDPPAYFAFIQACWIACAFALYVLVHRLSRARPAAVIAALALLVDRRTYVLLTWLDELQTILAVCLGCLY